MPNNWGSVEIKHLRALRAVAETGTFWAAAEALSESGVRAEVVRCIMYSELLSPQS